MGVLRQRYGRWYIDLIIQGKRYRKVASTSKKLAELALHDIQVKAERKQLGFLERRDIPLRDFFKEYSSFSATNHRAGTQARYRAVINHFLRFMSECEPSVGYLSGIRLEHMEKYKMYRRSQPVPRNGMYDSEKACSNVEKKGAKAYTVNFELTALRTMFYYALKMNYLEINPAKNIRKLKTDDVQKRRFLTEEECSRLLKAASSEEYPILYAFMATGMRKGELVNLEWSDIDFDRRSIKIQNKSFWCPKTGAREIPVNSGLFEVLNRLPRKSHFVFTDKKNRQLDADTLRLSLIKTAKSAGIKNLTQVHALRHSFCSQLLQKGVDLPTAQKLMGHTNIQTTMIYSHQTAEHLRSAISKIELIGPR